MNVEKTLTEIADLLDDHYGISVERKSDGSRVRLSGPSGMLKFDFDRRGFTVWCWIRTGAQQMTAGITATPAAMTRRPTMVTELIGDHRFLSVPDGFKLWGPESQGGETIIKFAETEVDRTWTTLPQSILIDVVDFIARLFVFYRWKIDG